MEYGESVSDGDCKICDYKASFTTSGWAVGIYSKIERGG